MKKYLAALMLLSASFSIALTVHSEPLSDLNLENLKPIQNTSNQSANVTKNPFLPAVQSLGEVSIQDLILTGVVRSESEQWALVNGQALKTGDKLAGYDVSEIKDSSVVLKQGELSYELKMLGLQ